MKMAGLLAETCWWTYYKPKYINKIKVNLLFVISFTNLIKAQNMDNINIICNY
jgi:hypothetical protein